MSLLGTYYSVAAYRHVAALKNASSCALAPTIMGSELSYLDLEAGSTAELRHRSGVLPDVYKV
jgi:hypothetical protein